MSIAGAIKQKLTKALNPKLLEIIDESSKHAGHAAMKGLNKTETHFIVRIVSDEFNGLPMIKRHRIIYELLDQEFQQGLHALTLWTKTTAETG